MFCFCSFMCVFTLFVRVGSFCKKKKKTTLIPSFILPLTNSANVLRNSDDAVPNERDAKIFFQPQASKPNDPDPPFVSVAASK